MPHRLPHKGLAVIGRFSTSSTHRLFRLAASSHAFTHTKSLENPAVAPSLVPDVGLIFPSAASRHIGSRFETALRNQLVKLLQHIRHSHGGRKLPYPSTNL